MPAVLDDPTAPPIFRVSDNAPFSAPFGDASPDISPRQVTLRDRITIATLVPFSSPRQVPHKLLTYLCELLNREIEKGDTYPMTDHMSISSFGEYWFANFGAVMIVGDVQSVEEVGEMESRGVEWSKECLGSFFIKPNYPGRSAHICNGGFLVTDAKRNRGVGRLMGEGYIEWAPKLGYTYSMFNLVYETNVASLRIWDALGFKRIGRIKGAGNLKSQPGELVDAIIFGRELGGDGDEYVSEERFDKIRFYLKTGTYPNGSDRAEKSRLRSAATHYRLVQGVSEDGQDDKLMLKGKEVVSDPHKQYEIARNMHSQGHGGINKTTASIAEHYHWVRIKETVSAAIKNCAECKDSAPKKTPSTYPGARRTHKDFGAIRGFRSTVTAQSDPVTASLNPSSTGPNPSTADMAFPDPHNTDFTNMPVDPQIMHDIHRQWDEAAAAVAATNVANGGTTLSMEPNNAVGGPTHAFVNDSRGPGGGVVVMVDDDEEDDVSTRLRETLEKEMGSDSRRAQQQSQSQSQTQTQAQGQGQAQSQQQKNHLHHLHRQAAHPRSR